MAKVVYFYVFNACQAEIAVDTASDISNQEGIAGFGDKKLGGFTARAILYIFLQGSFDGTVHRNGSAWMSIMFVNDDRVFLEI